MEPAAVRAAALLAAAAAHSGAAPAAPDLITYAGQFVPWIGGVAGVTTQLVTSITVDGALQPVRIITTGGEMAITANATVDNSTVTIQVLPEDDHGDVTPDQLTWANDDAAAAVADWAVSADTHTYTGTLKHVEGTVNVTATDPAASGVAPAQIQVVVGPAATSQLSAKVTVS